MTTLSTRHPGLAALREASARIGADTLLVQAAGGNSSFKHGGVLWIKASGRWLARARDEPMFVPLDLAVLREGMARDEADAASRAVLPADGAQGLRPSIETSLHALLPHRVVMHAHCVAALAWLACRCDDAVFATRLRGLRWRRVAYARPGLPLTRAVQHALQGGLADVLMLDNHGIVVGAGSAPQAEALLREVARRLETEVQAAPVDAVAVECALAPHAEGTPYRASADAFCHALARDPRQRAFAAGGAPYPDHVVFLGGGLPVITPVAGSTALAWFAQRGAPVVLVAGVGTLVHTALDASGHALLRCLADVALRIAARADAQPVYLPPAEVQALQQWDAEKFRRAQAR